MEKSSIEVIVDEKLTVAYWRARFTELVEKTESEGFAWSRRNLLIYDNYFLAAAGKDAVRNVREGRGGLEPTMRVVKALEKLIEAKGAMKAESDKLAKRQKLVLS